MLFLDERQFFQEIPTIQNLCLRISIDFYVGTNPPNVYTYILSDSIVNFCTEKLLAFRVYVPIMLKLYLLFLSLFQSNESGHARAKFYKEQHQYLPLLFLDFHIV